MNAAAASADMILSAKALTRLFDWSVIPELHLFQKNMRSAGCCRAGCRPRRRRVRNPTSRCDAPDLPPVRRTLVPQPLVLCFLIGPLTPPGIRVIAGLLERGPCPENRCGDGRPG